jgi:hypothetical protein
MVIPTEVIKRNRYFSGNPTDIAPHDSINHAEDFREYHIPLIHMHHAHLHDRGIAGGLAVGVSVNDDGKAAVEVQPGVAVDGNGELIVLSADGQADISPNEPGEEDSIGPRFLLGTQEHAGQTRYLTIQFAERLLFNEGVAGKLEQTPWLRLQPVDGDGAFVDDGVAIVLAIVEVDVNGSPTVRVRAPDLHGRRLIGASAGSLRIRGAIDDNGTADHATTAEMAALENGGLRMTVAATTDRIELGHAGGGNFAELEVDADSASFAGALTVHGALHSQEDLQVEGNTLLQGNVGIGSTEPEARLHIQGGTDTTLEGGGLLVLGRSDGLNLSLDGNKIMARDNGQKASLMLQANGGDLTVNGQKTESQRFVIKDNGNVGIGTAQPDARLHIPGGSDASLTGGGFLVLGQINRINLALDSNEIMARNNGQATNLMLQPNGGDLTVHALKSESQRFVIKDNGRVGIGTSFPGTQLHVTERMAVGLNFRSGGAITFFPPDGFAFFHIDNGPAGGRPMGRLRISQGNKPGDQEIISILQSRNVGIGTPTPAVRLHVKGNRIRLTNAGTESRFIDLRADGSALDLESRGGDLFINNHGLTFTRIRNFVNISSRDFKEQIVDLSVAEALDLFGRLRAVKYRHKDDPNQRQHIGFVAEELPTLLTTPDQKAYKPTDILAILTMVIQRQQAQIQDLLKITDTAKAETTTKNTTTP